MTERNASPGTVDEAIQKLGRRLQKLDGAAHKISAHNSSSHHESG
jgi:hypothetical protein